MLFHGGISEIEKDGVDSGENMNYRKMHQNIFMTMLVCLIMLSSLPLNMAFAEESGSGSLQDPYIVKIAFNGESELSAGTQGDVSGSITYAWGYYDKTQHTSADGVIPISGATGSEYTVTNYTNENIMYFCWVYVNATLRGTVYYEFKIKAPANPTTDPDDNMDPPQGISAPVPTGAGQPVNGSFSSQDDQPVNITKIPAAVKVKPAKRGKVSVSWKKLKKTKKMKALLGKIKSVQIQYSTDPDFRQDVHSKTIRKNKTKVDLKLQKNTVYYIRVRYAGSTGVSNWSAKRRVMAR